MMDPNDATTMRSHPRIGNVLREKWRVDRLLGVGGMGSVYAATHLNNGKRVALKILHPELSVIPEVRSRFLREGYVANKVTHPAIVSILDDDVAEDGSVFLVMELLEGETVEALRERSGNCLPVSQVVQIIDQLLGVLAAAHDAGIVHRDIKPENLFLTRDGTLKVLDFGIARLRELQSTKITVTGAGTMGTPAFMPQEQARGRSELVSLRSDIWAVGATMFTLLSGRLVHDAETVNELLLAAMTQQAPPLLSVLPMFSPAVAAVIDRALAYEQSARWPDARTMQTALRQAAATIGVFIQDRTSFSGVTPFPSSGVTPFPSDRFEAAAQPSPSSPGAMDGPPPAAPAVGLTARLLSSAPEGQAPPIRPAPPIMATAPAVTMGPGRSAPLQPKRLAAAGGLLLVLVAVGLWLLLGRPPSPLQVQATPPTPAVTMSAPTPSADLAMTVEPVPSDAPRVTPSPPAVEAGAASAALSVSVPSARPVATPPPRLTGTLPKGPVVPKKKDERDLLNRRN